MSCSTPGEDKWSEGGGKPQGGPGLVSGHAYSLLAVKQAGPHRLVNIRNPWGNFEWNGNWSDNSPLWTEDIKRQLCVTLDANDGCFWMVRHGSLAWDNLLRATGHHFACRASKISWSSSVV